MDPFKSSRFRFLDSHPFSFECKYTDIVLPSSNVDQVVVKTNGDLFALPINGPTGQLYVRPVNGSERFTHKVPRLNCHKYAVSTFAFDPFNSSFLMTGAEDGEIRLWKIPKEGIVSNENDPVLTLEGHRRKILNMEYNPVASDLLATGSSDGSCKIWNISSKHELMSIELQGSQLQEMKWDYTGSLLCTGTKSREYHIWDPRTVNVVTNWVGHASPRRSYMTWLGDSYYLVTTGYSKQSNREVVLRDIRNINNIVYTITADNSPGPFIPFYNPCCHILWYSGRGDAKLNGIDVDDVSMWTNREGGNSITINMKSSVKSLAILPQSFIDIKRNEVDKFLEINMDCGVNGFDVILPHQAGAAITEIYGRLPIASPAITTKDWLQGSIEKPKTKEVTSPYSSSKPFMAGRHQSDSTSMKLIKPADMRSFIQESRQKSFSKEELDSFNKGLLSLVDTINTTSNTIKSTENNSSLQNSLNVTTLFRGSAGSGRSEKNSVSSIRTTNGVSRRTSIYKAPANSQSTLRKGTAVAQLEQSKNRLCLNLNRQKKDSIPTSKEIPRTGTTQSTPSRGYRVSDISGMERSTTQTKPVEKASTLGRIPDRTTPAVKGNERVGQTGVSSSGVTLGELKRNQGNTNNLPSLSSLPGSRLPTVSPAPSSQVSSSSVTPVSSRGPSLNIDNVHLRSGSSSKSSVILQETRSSWNRNSSEHDKELAKIQSRLDSIENTLLKYDEINRKLDVILTKLDSMNDNNTEEIKQSLSIIRNRLGC